MTNPEYSIQVLEIQRILNRLKIFQNNNKKIDENGIVTDEYISTINEFKSIMNNSIEKDTLTLLEKILSKPIVKIGDGNDVIRYLQWVLNLDTSGIFDIKTESAVIRLQCKYKIAPDGIVGNETWSKIIG